MINSQLCVCLAASHWAQLDQTGVGWWYWVGSFCLRIAGLLPHQPGIFGATSTWCWGGARGSSLILPSSSRWIGTIKSSIRLSCWFVPGFFGELLVQVVVKVRVSTEQVLGQPVDPLAFHRTCIPMSRSEISPSGWSLGMVLLLLPSRPSHPPPHSEPWQEERQFVLEKRAQSSAALECAGALCCKLPAGCRGAPRLTPSTQGVLRAKGVQLHPHSTASEEGAGQGTGGERCSVLQGRNMKVLLPNF